MLKPLAGTIALALVATLFVAGESGAAIAPRHHAPLRHVALKPRHRVVHLVPPAVMAQWTKVAICEEGGNWHVRGPRFSGGLGISNANWVIFGGRQFAPNAALATPEQQVVVARRIQAYPPDQWGCTGSW
jgi:hypothetical protein